MFVYERLRFVHMCLKEEQNAAQVLAAVAAHALCRSFDTAVEKKRGISNLELLYQEISRADRVKKQRQELKKLKKKQKKLVKKLGHLGEEAAGEECKLCADDGRSSSQQHPSLDLECTCLIDEQGYESEVDHDASSVCGSDSIDRTGEGGCAVVDKSHGTHTLHTGIKEQVIYSCSCDLAIVPEVRHSICSKSIDCGYGSDPSLLSSRTPSLVSTPDGSEIACSEGFCNHDCAPPTRRNWQLSVGEPLTLQQMLVSKLTLSSFSIIYYYYYANIESQDDSADSDDDLGAVRSEPIPDAVLLDFACRQSNIQAQREKLRQDLRHRFATMCNITKLANRPKTTSVKQSN